MLIHLQDIVTRRMAENGIMVIKGDFPIDNELRGYIKILDHNFYKHISYHGVRGLIDGYINNEWETDNFNMLFDRLDNLMISDYANKNGMLGEKLSNFFLKFSKNPKPEVDLSTDFYKKFLDKRMTYSCGYWNYLNNDLDKAQEKKYDMICKKAGLVKRDLVLDIGCGWGGFMGYAVENYGVRTTGITLLKEEVDFIYNKYPDLPIRAIQSDLFEYHGNYDKIVAIGIFEYMTVKNYKKFFAKIRSLLKPNGIFIMQTVLRTEKERNWILEGMDYFDSFMDSVGEFAFMEDVSRAYSNDFILEDLEVLSGQYKPTLKAWLDRILENDSIDVSQKKLWEIYLNFNILGFEKRYLDPYQFVFSPKNKK